MWKPISGFESTYEVSDEGEVRSIDRIVKSVKGEYFKKGEIKAQRNKNNGYRIVDLYKEGKSHTKHVHRLVAIEFLDNPDNKPTVNHIDGDVNNNHVSNLEWATYSEQNRHFYSKGLKSKENIDKAVKAMNEANSRKIKRVSDGKIYNSISDASRDTGVSVPWIVKQAKGREKGIDRYDWEYIAKG